jgi:molybdopterin molybdotransferase
MTPAPRGREFFTTRTVAEALAGFRPARRTPAETIPLTDALHRIPAAPVTAAHPLPGFARSTVDGYAVRAADTYGVSEGLPGYLDVAGAIRMGAAPDVAVSPVSSGPTRTPLPGPRSCRPADRCGPRTWACSRPPGSPA